MTDFETFLCCLLIPLAYTLMYIAGRYNLLGFIYQRIEEKTEELNSNEDEGDTQ